MGVSSYFVIKDPQGTHRVYTQDPAEAKRQWALRCEGWAESCDGQTVSLVSVMETVLEEHELIEGAPNPDWY